MNYSYNLPFLEEKNIMARILRICEVQYKFYNEEIALAKAIGVGCPEYKYNMFFSRRSVLTQEYMGFDDYFRRSIS